MDNKVIDGTVVNKKLLMLFLAAVPGTIFAHVDFYGQVNRGLLMADDGRETNTFFVDNDASSSRLGVKATSMLDSQTTVGGKIEFSVISASNSEVNQRDNNGDTYNGISVRHVDSWIDTCFGKFSLGHGSMATDGVAESDLGDTWNTAYSYSDTASGMYFHPVGTALASTNDPRVSSQIDTFDGGRKPRLRYDTPSFSGFMVSGAVGANGVQNVSNPQYDSDIALTYSGHMSAVEVAAALGYSKQSHAGNANAVKNLVFSAALLHTPSGMNVAFATGKRHHADTARTNAKYTYISLGKMSDFNSCGKTNIALDLYNGKHLSENSDKPKHFGIGVEQHLDKVNSIAYATARKYKYKRTGTNYDSINAFMVGIKVSFGAKLAA